MITNNIEEDTLEKMIALLKVMKLDISFDIQQGDVKEEALLAIELNHVDAALMHLLAFKMNEGN